MRGCPKTPTFLAVSGIKDCSGAASPEPPEFTIAQAAAPAPSTRTAAGFANCRYSMCIDDWQAFQKYGPCTRLRQPADNMDIAARSCRALGNAVKLLHKKFCNLVEVFGKFLATVDDCLELLLFVEVFHQGALYGVEALEYLGDRIFHSGQPSRTWRLREGKSHCRIFLRSVRCGGSPPEKCSCKGIHSRRRQPVS